MLCNIGKKSALDEKRASSLALLQWRREFFDDFVELIWFIARISQLDEDEKYIGKIINSMFANAKFKDIF